MGAFAFKGDAVFIEQPLGIDVQITGEHVGEHRCIRQFSLQMIANRNELTAYFIKMFPWFAGSLFFIGVVFSG